MSKGEGLPDRPGRALRVTGDAPLMATSFECEKLRRNLCEEVFTAKPPDEGSEKYDATAGTLRTISMPLCFMRWFYQAKDFQN